MFSPNSKSIAWSAGLVGFAVCSLLTARHAEAKKNKKPSCVVDGVVLTMQDQPLAGVSVEFAGSDEQPPVPPATTDPAGAFSIKLHPGDYVLKLSRDGFVPFEGPISLLKGQEQSVRVQMLDATMGQRNVAIRAYNAAVEAYEAGHVDAAIGKLEESAAADPSFSEPLSLLAQIRSAESGAAAPMAIEAFNEGAQASQAGNDDIALERFEVALELDPELVEAHVGLASIRYNQSRYDQALAAVERALALNPDHATALRLRYLIHDVTGDRQAAATAIRAYGAIDPGDAVELLSRRAAVDFRQERRQQARDGYLQVLAIDPDQAQAHYRLGVLYAREDRTKARGHLERFIELAPTAPEAAEAKQLLATLAELSGN